MEEDFQGWKYDAHFEDNKLVFTVKPSTELKCDRFFKYYALNDNSVDALTKYYVYASHPNQLNDSIDCNSQILNFETATEKDLQGLYENLLPQFVEVYGGEEALKKWTSENFKEVSYRHIGIVSLASQNNNAHLWHVYAQDGQGFCVEFDVDKFPFKCYGPNPIQYVEKLSRFDVDGNVPTALLVQTNVKTKTWEKEGEWRLLVSNPQGFDFNSFGEDGTLSQQFNFGDEHNRKMWFPLVAIKSITLGERFFRSPNIRCYPITEEEFECVFLDDKEDLRCRVLDFLIGKPFKLFWVTNNLGELTLQQIEVVRLKIGIYRVIIN